jgi:hypothetical protein
MAVALKLLPLLIPLLVSLEPAPVRAQGSQYPPLDEYMMAPEEEAALARSAAPEGISSRATIKVLTTTGYETAVEGDNDFVCMVLRGWAAPSFSPVPERDLVYDSTLRAPICLNPAASRTVLPYQELRARLGMSGRTPDEIAEAVQAAYARGELPRMDAVGFGYMWSADQVLGPAGAWHPHMMVYAPYYDNAMLGDNEPGGPAPFVNDDAGTPFAVSIIRVADELAIEARP